MIKIEDLETGAPLSGQCRAAFRVFRGLEDGTLTFTRFEYRGQSWWSWCCRQRRFVFRNYFLKKRRLGPPVLAQGFQFGICGVCGSDNDWGQD